MFYVTQELSTTRSNVGNGKVISRDHRFGGNKAGVNIHGLAVSHAMFGYEVVGEVPGPGIA